MAKVFVAYRLLIDDSLMSLMSNWCVWLFIDDYLMHDYPSISHWLHISQFLAIFFSELIASDKNLR